MIRLLFIRYFANQFSSHVSVWGAEDKVWSGAFTWDQISKEKCCSLSIHFLFLHPFKAALFSFTCFSTPCVNFNWDVSFVKKQKIASAVLFLQHPVVSFAFWSSKWKFQLLFKWKLRCSQLLTRWSIWIRC